MTLVQVFWIRGTSNATTDLRRHYMIADRPFCIQRELAGFAEDLDLRGLKKDLTDLHHFSEYERYGERLRLLLRIDSSMALKLLHKTQSAKNLGDLNAFLREFMLDPPRTFEVADRLVEEFVELDQAHRAVVTAREQIEVLAPARQAHAAHQEAEAQLIGLDRQLNAIDPYLKLRRRELLEAELARLVTEDNSLAGHESEQQARVDQDYDALQRLEEAHRAQGGGRIEELEHDIEQAGRERDKRLSNRNDAERLCQGLDWTLPDRPEALTNLDARGRQVERELRLERDVQVEQRNDLKTAIERQFGAFKRGWPMEAVDLDETLASAAEYLALLTRIEQDGLPRFEERFSELLKEQSTENLAALNRHVDEARKQIRERMALVNEGLSEAEFNTGTYLQIEVNERQLPDVLLFREQVREVLQHVYTSAPDATDAEARFAVLSGIVKRLAGEEPEDKRWRQQVLDVRLHVEFIGRELDADGNELEVYRSGAGKSGGQREKLATTCLAAALRYQLGGRDGDLPQFAPVILDEAFGKADNEFTELAMRIFERFGFQMIVATPLKSVMTLEPFIGGACFVAIEDRKRSTTLQIAYDQQRRRLALPERLAPPAPVHHDGRIAPA